MSDNNSTPTLGQMIERYKALEAHVEMETAKFTDTIKPYQQAMECINGALKAELLRMASPDGKSSFACEFGTAYLSRTLSVKVVDRHAFLSYARDNERFDMLDIRALKDPVREWIEANETTPTSSIGLSTETVVKCNIRGS